MLRLSKIGRFGNSEQFTPAAGAYGLMPFRFERLSDEHVLVVTESGQYAVIGARELNAFVAKKLPSSNSIYRKLRTIGALVDDSTTVNARLEILRLRSKYQDLPSFTGLHMMVVTLRCNQSCPYCQVSRQSENKSLFDMSVDNADRALDHIFRSPNPYIKIEFQGGESLLNFDLIKYVVGQAQAMNRFAGKNLAFVAATNMTYITDEIIEFFGENRIFFSTSLDGPADLHNTNRPYKGNDAYRVVCDNIRIVQQRLGKDSVSALMTTTAGSLPRHKEIVDKYVEMGFDGIFLRPLSPYGFAIKTKSYYQYSAEEWFDFYAATLEYIIQLNLCGVRFIEFYTSILLQKIVCLQNTGFVNLQSPAGNGTMGVIYDYNGNVYGSDEGRMMAQMQDERFLLGHVKDPYEHLFLGNKLVELIDETISQSLPQCSDCAFLPWCGTDPDYHWSTQKDVVGHKAFSGFCHKNTQIFKHLIALLETDPARANVLNSWLPC